ncbi:MAG: DUF4375 domain-containing protein [Bacteroidota bacterium]
MKSNFLPSVSITHIKDAQVAGNEDYFYDLLVQPLHEELYRRQTFDFLDELSDGQQLMLTYDYLRTQVLQGGFIQFIHNGYIGLLPSMIEQFMAIGETEMSQVLDDVLKVFVLNRDLLSKATTVQEFALLYDELKEFEGIDERFYKLNKQAITHMLGYASAHLDEFVITGPPLS